MTRKNSAVYVLGIKKPILYKIRQIKSNYTLNSEFVELHTHLCSSSWNNKIFGLGILKQNMSLEINEHFKIEIHRRSFR